MYIYCNIYIYITNKKNKYKINKENKLVNSNKILINKNQNRQ